MVVAILTNVRRIIQGLGASYRQYIGEMQMHINVERILRVHRHLLINLAAACMM